MTTQSKLANAAGLRMRDAVCGVVLVLVACWFAWDVLWARALRAENLPSYDIYAYFYPNVLYALRSLHEGHGLFWNSLQNCGQPFFANPQTALLYPPNWIFLVADVNTGILALTVFHLSIGAFGTYALCRHLALDRLAAIAGALAFELGGTTLSLAAWMPNVSAGYAWMPVAVLLCERTLGVPCVPRALLLALVLGVQLLAGHPQVAFLTYLILFARAAWAFSSRERDVWSVAFVGVAMVLAPLFAAVHLVPGIELTRESVRSAPLTMADANAMSVPWEKFQDLVRNRVTGAGTTLTLVTACLVGIALIRRSRASLFYGALAFSFAVLSFDNPVSQSWMTLPVAGMFRGTDRYLWPAGFCLSVLVAQGIHAIGRFEAEETANWRRKNALYCGGGMTVGGAAFCWLAGGTLRASEWALGFALSSVALALLVPNRRCRTACAATAVVVAAVGALDLARLPVLGLLSNAAVQLERNSAAFASVSQQLTNEHRIAAVGENSNYSLMPKSSSVFGVRGVTDYEPMTSRRYAEYYVKTVYGSANDLWMVNLNQYTYLAPAVPRSLPLLNLLAARFLLVDDKLAQNSPKLASFSQVARFDGVTVYENPAALPRAFFVPSIRVVPESREMLRMLSSRSFAPQSEALLPEAPPDGYRGSPASTGSAQILEDRSEELTLRASSSEGGFVFLSDQHYPGWTATVNGAPTPVLLADYAFRLVRIPAGESTIVFRYAPASVRLGAFLTLVSLLLSCVVLVVVSLRARYPALAMSVRPKSSPT